MLYFCSLLQLYPTLSVFSSQIKKEKKKPFCLLPLSLSLPVVSVSHSPNTTSVGRVPGNPPFLSSLFPLTLARTDPNNLSLSLSRYPHGLLVAVAAATFHWFSLRHPAEAASLSESMKHGESSGDLDARKFGKQEVKCSLDGSNEEKTEGLSACEGGGQLTTSRSCAAHPAKILQIELPKYLISYCHLINVILIFLEPPASPTCRMIH
ncbi:hypothetical protein ACSBR2_025484 [Camellia fascicularis]